MQPISNWYKYHQYREKKATKRAQVRQENPQPKPVSRSLLQMIFNMVTK